ncbi:hypothetical protein A2215_02205 [Candidatus Berkelbacteria bacterium RIFOXYA2_FULL_43_10]|uniref:YokE-like PH domain-containing protein n=1 Tax=Candidatus Berkelbacteria bacterium RIFOXYA2_FULL_43_10 TaxID=1797472 RepID=A0A1F5E3F4_9BACT|nr:MAG: hypothetical protein A2215_02205 [Candidatus Berkelbacteria bacterium RIFOXYA2_FULL_43_10]
MSKEFTFNGQRPDESVEEVVKNHPYVLFFPGLKAVVLLAVPVGIFIFYGANIVFSVATFLCLILAFAIFAKAYYIYSASVLIVTSERILYLDQLNFFKRKIIESELNKVQDIASSTEGMVKTTLNFGDLIIRTAGAGQGNEIIIKNISDPYSIQQEITKRIR